MSARPVEHLGDDELPQPSILNKAFELLHAFTPDQRILTLTEISRATGMAKSTVHRLLAKLVEAGAIETHRSGYKIGLELLHLGSLAPASLMRDISMPYLAGLHRWTGQAVHLVVLRGPFAVYIERLARRSSPCTITQVGARLPAYCTAAGKAMLAFEEPETWTQARGLIPLTEKSVRESTQLVRQLQAIRNGAALAEDHEEAQLGVQCLAVPIRVNRYAVGAISIGFGIDDSIPPGVPQALIETAQRIASESIQCISGKRSHWALHADMQVPRSREDSSQSE